LFQAQREKSYHPAVTTFLVYNPFGNLACGLNDQKTAEALGDLEDGCAVSQSLVPGPYRCTLQQSLTPKDPFLNALEVGSLAAKGAFDPARIGVGIDGELVEAPDQEGGYGQPLRPSYYITQKPSEARRVWRGQAQYRVDEVVGAEGEGEGEATGAAANVEGEGYGEDDGAEEGCRRDYPRCCSPHADAVVAKLVQRRAWRLSGAAGEVRGD